MNNQDLSAMILQDVDFGRMDVLSYRNALLNHNNTEACEHLNNALVKSKTILDYVASALKNGLTPSRGPLYSLVHLLSELHR